jgi:hypothetical protein
MTDPTTMTFNEIVELFKEYEFQIETYRNELNRLNIIIEGYDWDNEIIELKEIISKQHGEIGDWRNIAAGLADGLVATQEQLADLSVGIRPSARDALQKYNDQLRCG